MSFAGLLRPAADPGVQLVRGGCARALASTRAVYPSKLSSSLSSRTASPRPSCPLAVRVHPALRRRCPRDLRALLRRGVETTRWMLPSPASPLLPWVSLFALALSPALLSDRRSRGALRGPGHRCPLPPRPDRPSPWGGGADEGVLNVLLGFFSRLVSLRRLGVLRSACQLRVLPRFEAQLVAPELCFGLERGPSLVLLEDSVHVKVHVCRPRGSQTRRAFPLRGASRCATGHPGAADTLCRKRARHPPTNEGRGWPRGPGIGVAPSQRVGSGLLNPAACPVHQHRVLQKEATKGGRPIRS